MTNTAVVRNDLTLITYVFSIVTSKTARGVKVADVVRVDFPVCFHLREEVSLIDPLSLTYCLSNGIRPLVVQVVVVSSIEAIQARSDALESFVFCCIRLIQ